MATKYEVRHSSHPQDVKNYDTQKLRQHFLIENLFETDNVNMIYTLFDRFIAGGAVPVSGKLSLETIDPLKAPYFLERRELGIINIGGAGKVTVDGTGYELNFKEALYVGQGNKDVVFESTDKTKPAKFYFNSAPAHTQYPTKKVTKKEAEVVELGSLETCNARTLNKLIVNSVLKTCQLQMGMTELKPGSVWNTMPSHVHDRRMEVYLYFEVPQGQAVCHMMGQPQETRHIWMQDCQAVISPNWSIHSGTATSNYTFIWGMAGENLDYGDMDVVQANELR